MNNYELIVFLFPSKSH